MAKPPQYASIGTKSGSIDVRLSYKIIDLFSEGLYASPNKAIEELVANAFDAGAQTVAVSLSPSLHAQDATIVVADDGDGMDDSGLRQHWLIGTSNKRKLPALPRGRQQIGKFGIGKLATYVLAERLTHISKKNGKYHSTSMDYSVIEKRHEKEVEPKQPITLPLRKLSEDEAKKALAPWLGTSFVNKAIPLFGTRATASWTVTILSSLKPKVHELKGGTLEWVLRTALPLRPDFKIILGGKTLTPSKQGKGLLQTWVLGKDLTDLPRPAPKTITASEDTNLALDDERRFGFDVPGLGRVTGYAEAYKDLLTGKSDDLGRSYGFFVYVFGRLVNVTDGHFGISPNELRHGTFGRFRLVIHIDALDDELRSNRESISEGPLLEVARNVLRGVFNAVRPIIDKHEKDEEPGAKLSRKLADTPASLSRTPIIDLARSVLDGAAHSRFIKVPDSLDNAGKAAFLASLEARSQKPETFLTALQVDYTATPDAGIAQFDTFTGTLHINAWHPFVATFYDDFAASSASSALELLAMAEVISEAHLYSIGVKADHIAELLEARDALLRSLARESGRKSAYSVALDLDEARNNPDALETQLCAAFESLGFEVTKMGQRGKPDGVARALLPPDDQGNPQQYAVSLEAKSKKKDKGKVSAATVNVSTIVRHRKDHGCDHAIVVGRDFPSTETSALASEIADDTANSKALGTPKTISLLTISDLQSLIRLRPTRQLGLKELRGLFSAPLPSDTHAWVEALKKKRVKKPPFKEIIATIEKLQKQRKKALAKYAALLVELSHLTPSIDYDTEAELREICLALMQMAPGDIYAGVEHVELNQSAANVLATVSAATKDYPPDER